MKIEIVSGIDWKSYMQVQQGNPQYEAQGIQHPLLGVIF